MIQVIDIDLPELLEYTYRDYDWSYLKERHGYRLTPKQAMEMKILYDKKIYSQIQLAKMYKCDPATIYYVVKKSSLNVFKY